MSTGTTAMITATAAGTATGTWISAGGCGCRPVAVMVTAGTTSLASRPPSSSPAAAAGMATRACSRQSSLVSWRLVAPSAASSAMSWARSLAVAAATRNPPAARSTAAAAIASIASCGAAPSGLASRALATAALLVTVVPCGRPGSVTGPPVRSHHSVTPAGPVLPVASSACWSSPWSTITPPLGPVSVGKADTMPTTRTAHVRALER